MGFKTLTEKRKGDNLMTLPPSKHIKAIQEQLDRITRKAAELEQKKTLKLETVKEA